MIFHILDYVIVVTSYKLRSYNPGNPGNLRFPRTPLPFTGTYYRNLLQEPTVSPDAPSLYRNLLQEPTVPRTPLPLQEQYVS